jgi:hypothetical protein
MSSRAAEISRLKLMIERLVDAELLSEEDAAELLAENDAASRSLAEADLEAVRDHIAQVARITQALVDAGALSVEHGGQQIESAARALAALEDVNANPSQ